MNNKRRVPLSFPKIKFGCYSEETRLGRKMNDGGYKIRNLAAIHFITFAVAVPIAIGRVDVFTRKGYPDIILESLRQ